MCQRCIVLRLVLIHNWQDDDEQEEASASHEERPRWQPKGRGKHAANHATWKHQQREAIRKPLLMKIKFIQGKLDQSQSRVETLSSELGVQTALASGSKDSGIVKGARQRKQTPHCPPPIVAG